MKKNTEIVIGNAQSALEKQFGNISPDKAAEAFYAVEQSRANWLAQAVVFGMCASVAKAKIGHGKFMKWLTDAFEKYAKKRSQSVHIVNTLPNEQNGESLMTARRYMSLARKVLKQIESPSETTIFGAKYLRYMGENKRDVGEYALILADHDQTLELVEYLTAGMSLRSLTSALVEANAGADIDDADDIDGDAHGKSGPPQSKQTDFLDSLFMRATELEAAVEDELFAALKKDDALAYAERLIELGTKIKKSIEGK